MQLTPTQIPVDSRTKQLTAVVQTLFPPHKEKRKKAVWPRETRASVGADEPPSQTKGSIILRKLHYFKGKAHYF